MTQSMAHPSNIAIPARFIFRPFSTHWETCCAEIISWRDETPTFLGRRSRALIASAEDVLVRVDVPFFAGLGQSFREFYPLESSYTVAIYRSEVPGNVLQPYENPRDTPDIAGREFSVLACARREFEKVVPSLTPKGVAKNAWKMRNEFLNMEKETDALCSFLNRWGLWSHDRGYHVELDKKMPGLVLALPHLLWEQRDKYRSALAGSPRTWLSTARPLSFRRIDETPYFIVDRSYCEEALEATITIDHLSNAKFGICKRSDCRRLYVRETKQKRLYCTTRCAHLANVRKLRAEKRKTESKGRNYATRKG
jgi:hypothetical protein